MPHVRQDGERFWKLPEAYIRGNNVSRSPVTTSVKTLLLCKGSYGSKQVRRRYSQRGSTPSTRADQIHPSRRIGQSSLSSFSSNQKDQKLVHTETHFTSVAFTNSSWIRSRSRKRRTGGAESVGADHDQQEEEEMDSTDEEVVEEVRRQSPFFFLSSFHKHASSRDVN